MKKSKSFIIITMCFMLLASLKFPVLANSNQELLEISPRYTNIASTTTTLTNNGGKAYCKASVQGESSSSSLKVFIYLEKNINGTWVTQASDYKTITSSSLTLTMNVAVGSGTYRVRGSYYANGENTIKYSTEKKF